MAKNEKSVDSESTKIEVKVNPDSKSESFAGPMSISSDDLTDKAIDDIAKTDTEKAIKAEDETIAEEFVKKPTFKEKLSSWFHSWWDNPKKRYTVLGVSAALLLLVFIIPPSRYAVLNTVGVRATASIVVVDESTGQPLKNVDVTIQEQTAETDIEGRTNFSGLKLGTTTVTVDKIAYAENTFEETIGLGSNDFESTNLTPIGTQFSFYLKDWLSQAPIEGGEVVFGESSALSNSEGLAVLTIEPTDEENITVTAQSEEYRDREQQVDTLSDQSNDVEMRIAKANYFVSNRDGNFDIYQKYADEEPSKIVNGSGNERQDMRFAVHPDRQTGILVSTRDGNRNQDGFLLSGLYKVNLETGGLEKIDESERFDLVGWVDGKLVFVKIAQGASGKNPDRHRLVILDLQNNNQTEVASSNYFNDVLVAHNKIFYAPSDAYKDNPDAALFSSDSNGNKTKIHDSEVYTIIQTNYDELNFDATGDWYSYSISGDNSASINGAPNNRTSKIFVPGTNDISIWVDQRDGKGVLLTHNSSENKDEVIQTQSGLRYPIHWLTDKHIIYRVVTNDETADYIMNLEGGEPVKLNDTSNISGTDRWYYYY